jgi:hypothetical protein
MQKPNPHKQPWDWKPVVRSRGIEWSLFAAAFACSTVFLTGSGESWLSTLDAALMVLACLSAAFWNRRRRKLEEAFRLLP